jgi:hypothetical protein
LFHKIHATDAQGVNNLAQHLACKQLRFYHNPICSFQLGFARWIYEQPKSCKRECQRIVPVNNAIGAGFVHPLQ